MDWVRVRAVPVSLPLSCGAVVEAGAPDADRAPGPTPAPALDPECATSSPRVRRGGGAATAADDDGCGPDGQLQLSFLCELLSLAEEARLWGLVAVVVEALLRDLDHEALWSIHELSAECSRRLPSTPFSAHAPLAKSPLHDSSHWTDG